MGVWEDSGKRWQLVIVCILLDFCRMASSATPPAVDGLSALPIAAPDPICTNALHCSQEYHATTVANEPVLLRWLTVLNESCQTESQCNAIMSEPITVVVGVYSRPGFFSDVTSAILQSSANVTRLWIVCNGSPYLEMFRELTLQLKARVEVDPAYRHLKVDFFGASLETGYFERFTRVLLAETKYVAVVDDDVIVAPRYLEICLRAASIKRFQGLIGAGSSSRILSQLSPKIVLNFSAGANDGLLGTHPRIMTNPGQDARFRHPRDELESGTCEQRAYLDSTVDAIFSPYFGSTVLMQSIFADKLWTMKTGEDITLAYSVRHHAKVPVLVFDDVDEYPGELDGLRPVFTANLAPFLVGVNRSWSCIFVEGPCGDDNFVQMVATEDRRRGYMVNDPLLKGSEQLHVMMRRRLHYHLWQQGWTLTPTRFFLDRDEDRQNAMLGSKPMSFCSDLLFVASHAQALAVKAQVLHLLKPQKATACDFEGNTCVVLLGVDREAVDRELGITENRRFLDMRLLDLHLDNEVGAESFPRLFARIMLKLQSVLEAVQPHRLWILEDGTVPSAAAAVCGGMLHIPIRLLDVPRERHGNEGHGQGPGQARNKGRGSPKSMSSMLIETMGRFQRQEPVPESEGEKLTTDSTTGWYGSDPPMTPPAVSAPLATAPTRPRHVHAAPAPPDLTSRRCDTESAYDDAVCLLNRLSGTETNELHGQHHPSVAIKFGADPLVSRGQGRMELRFRIVGVLIGFKYRIVLQEVDISRVIQQQEISFSPIDVSAEDSTEITAELDIMYIRHHKTARIKFAIGIWDTHAGLSDDEGMVGRTNAWFRLLKCDHGFTTENLCRLVNRASMALPSGMREPDHEPPKNPSIIVFLYLPSFEFSKDLEVCVQVVERLSPVLRNAYEVRVLVAWLIEREVAVRIRAATACSRVSFIHPQQLMDRIRLPVGGAIVIMSDDLKYPIDYLDRALEIVRGASQSLRENVVIGQEGYVLSEAAMGSKWSSEDGRQDNSKLNGKLVHVLRLGTIVIPTPSDHEYVFNSFLGQSLKIILNYHPHMRHVAFAHLAETNDVPRLMIIPPSSTSFDSGESPSQWQLQDWQPSDTEFEFLASDFGVLPHWSLLVNRHSPWQRKSSAWIGWLQKSYRSAAFSSQLANVPILSQKLNSIGTECDQSILNIPVAVMSQDHDLERRNQTLRLLNTVGFRNVSFPETIKWSNINIEQMTVRGVLSTSFFSRIERQNDTNFVGYLRYTANAISQVQRIRAAAAAKESIIIMEDDLMLGASVQTIQDIICSYLVLKNLPPSADMIYLEYCHEKCDELAYNDHHPNLARAVRPSCSAAILFTVKGAQRVADLCWPVFDVIDRMYPSLIRAGYLEAYIATPPLFYQDSFFRSNFDRTKIDQGAGRYHSPPIIDPPCWEARQMPHSVSNKLDLEHVFDKRFRNFDLDWRQIGVVIPGAEVRSILGMLEGGDRVNGACRYGVLETVDLTSQECRRFVWLKYGMPVSWTGQSGPGAQIIFRVLSGSSDEDGIPVGSWDAESSCGVLLDLDVDQDCAGWQSGEACRLEASLFSVDGFSIDGDCGWSSNVLRFSIFLVDMQSDQSGAVLQDPL